MTGKNIQRKSRYRELAMKQQDLPLFFQAWWLDAVADNTWDVIFEEQNNALVACLPFQQAHMYSFKLLKQPVITPSLGIWISYPPEQKYVTRLSYEQKLIWQVIEQLPGHHYFTLDFHPGFRNWLPLYWKGFHQTTKYTYTIDTAPAEDDLFSEMKDNIRREIKKAQKKVKVNTDENIEQLHNLVMKTFTRQDKKPRYDKNLLQKIHEKCKEHEQCQVLTATDESEKIHAAALLVWDSQKMYYLIGGGDPAFRRSGAHSLLMWESIKLAKQKGLTFDFEGSMIQAIERFFRSFGAVQTPYFKITKANSRVFKLLLSLKSGF